MTILKMSKFTVLCVIFLSAGIVMIQAFPVQEESSEDQNNSTYDDTHHIMDLTKKHQQLSQSDEQKLLLNNHSKPESNTDNENIDVTTPSSSSTTSDSIRVERQNGKGQNLDLSKGPENQNSEATTETAVYVTPLEKRIKRDSYEEKTLQTETKYAAGTPEHTHVGNVSPIPALYVTPFPKNLTENVSSTNVREANSNEKNDSDESSSQEESEKSSQSVTDDSNANGNSKVTRIELSRNQRDTHKSNSENDSKQSDADTTEQSSKPEIVKEELVVGFVGVPGIFLNGTDDLAIRNVTDTDSQRVARDTDGQVQHVPANYNGQQSSSSNDKKEGYVESTSQYGDLSSTPQTTEQSFNRKSRDTGSQVPEGNQDHQQSSTPHATEQSEDTKSHVKRNTIELKTNGQKPDVHGVTEENVEDTSGRVSQITYQNTAKPVFLAQKTKRFSEKDLKRSVRQVSEQQKDSQNREKTTGNENQSTKSSSEKSSVPRFGRSVQYQEESDESSNNPERNPVVFLATSSSKPLHDHVSTSSVLQQSTEKSLNKDLIRNARQVSEEHKDLENEEQTNGNKNQSTESSSRKSLVPRVGRSVQNQEERDQMVINSARNPAVYLATSSAKPLQDHVSTSSVQQQRTDKYLDKDLIRNARQVSEQHKDSEKEEQTNGNENQSTESSSEKSSVPRFGRSVQDQEESDELSNNPERNPVIFLATSSAKPEKSQSLSVGNLQNQVNSSSIRPEISVF